MLHSPSAAAGVSAPSMRPRSKSTFLGNSAQKCTLKKPKDGKTQPKWLCPSEPPKEEGGESRKHQSRC